MDHSLVIKRAELDELPFFLSLAEREGWNPGLEDAIPFYQADPHGFFVAKLGKENIGCISAVAYNEQFGFLGLYIVKPEYRGRGFGIELWKKGMEYLGDRIIGLDGVVEQQESYKKSGFKLYYRNIRFQSEFQGEELSSSLISLKELPLEKIVNYDRPIFGALRKSFLQKWIQMPGVCSLGKLQGDKLVGYGVIRQCTVGYKIGPLFADTSEIGAELYQGLYFKAGESPLFLDVPEVNLKALDLVKQCKMKKVFETARMYNKPPPSQELEKVYGVTSLELG